MCIYYRTVSKLLMGILPCWGNLYKRIIQAIISSRYIVITYSVGGNIAIQYEVAITGTNWRTNKRNQL